MVNIEFAAHLGCPKALQSLGITSKFQILNYYDWLYKCELFGVSFGRFRVLWAGLNLAKVIWDEAIPGDERFHEWLLILEQSLSNKFDKQLFTELKKLEMKANEVVYQIDPQFIIGMVNHPVRKHKMAVLGIGSQPAQAVRAIALFAYTIGCTNESVNDDVIVTLCFDLIEGLVEDLAISPLEIAREARSLLL